MTGIWSCLATEHDPVLVCLAMLICIVGSSVVFRLLERTKSASGDTRLGWIALASFVLGAMTWSTHFVAMMGFHPHASVVLDPILTTGSLLIAIGASALGLTVVVLLPRIGSPLGGAIIGLSVAWLHYVGMRNYQVDGTVTWDWVYVDLSVTLSVLLSVLSFSFYTRNRGHERSGAAVLLLALAIATLHFTGMAALTIAPVDLANPAGLSPFGLAGLAVVTALCGLLAVGCVAFSLAADTHAQDEKHRQLRQMALRDAMTNLPNRAHFEEKLGYGLTGRLSHRGLAVVMIDLSRFRAVNDTYGHLAGDELLIALSTRFQAVLQPDEFLARLAGDEFAAILPSNDVGEVRRRLARIAGVFDQPFNFQRFATTATASFGIALAPADGDDLDTLLANADLAMYRAKADRLPEPCFYTPAMDQAAREQRALVTRLRATIGTKAFHVEYQVQASLVTQEITGYEALCRWQDENDEPVSPSIFIPLAEETGEIVRLGTWVLETACREAAGWADPYSIAVNLSPVQLSDPQLIETVKRVLRETGLDPARLELELTESAIIRDRELASRQFFTLKKLGVKLAIDDFGVGYSSLDVLRSFPFDRIKLDASFMSNIVGDRQAIAILSAIALLGRKLNMPILAEGIETAEQLEVAAREGCTSMQGYLIGRPSRLLAEPASIRRSMSPVAAVAHRSSDVMAQAF